MTMSNDAEVRAREVLAHEFSKRGQLSVALAIRRGNLNEDGPYAPAVAAMIAFAAEARSHDGEWEAIGSAPCDGAPVLIWKPDERMVGEYMMSAYWDDNHFSGTPGWVPVGGHHRQGYVSQVTGTMQGCPTHWRHLPAPPVSAVPPPNKEPTE